MEGGVRHPTRSMDASRGVLILSFLSCAGLSLYMAGIGALAYVPFLFNWLVSLLFMMAWIAVCVFFQKKVAAQASLAVSTWRFDCLIRAHYGDII